MRAGGRNAKLRPAFCWLRVVRNRFPALTASLLTRVKSYDVETPAGHVTAIAGATLRSVVCVSAADALSPNTTCALFVSRRRYVNRTVNPRIRRPTDARGGVSVQLATAEGHSSLLVWSGTWSAPRSTHVTPRVRW